MWSEEEEEEEAERRGVSVFLVCSSKSRLSEWRESALKLQICASLLFALSIWAARLLPSIIVQLVMMLEHCGSIAVPRIGPRPRNDLELTLTLETVGRGSLCPGYRSNGALFENGLVIREPPRTLLFLERVIFFA